MPSRDMDDDKSLDRRDFMKGLGGVGLASLTGLSGCINRDEQMTDNPTDGAGQRLTRAYQIRELDARESTIERQLVESGVYGNQPNLAGTFGKGLAKANEFGELEPAAHQSLNDALDEGTNEAFRQIQLGGDKPLVNPQAALSFNNTGADPHTVPIAGHPEMGSDEAAAEMVEMYWAALLRDVAFANYGSNADVQAAYDELTGLSGYAGPDNGGPENSLFRDRMPGCEKGPFLSQFHLLEANYGKIPVDLRVDGKVEGQDYMTDFNTWYEIQRGNTDPVVDEPTRGERRYIATGRDLATFVEGNLIGHPFLHAAIALENGYEGSGRDFHDPANAQVGMTTQNTFIDYGTSTTIPAVLYASHLAQHTNWYHKWLAYRRARPEEYGGRVHVHQSDMDRTYDFLNDDLLNSEAVERTRQEYGTSLLPMAYSQGCPTHPSYPAGHAGIAGACGTVLKAFFDDEAELPVVYDVDENGNRFVRDDVTLTLGEEVNKMVSNHEMGRLFAGLHYRTDGIDGFLMGEALAVTFVQDLVRCSAASLSNPITFTSFDGETEYEITGDEIRTN